MINKEAINKYQTNCEKMIKISIITVTYNSVKTIEQTINSVITQDYPKIEYIIVDGGSTDGTLDVINKYKEYISILISEPDDGIYDAMNKGVRVATGDVVAFINSDDWYNEGAIRYVANDMVATGVSISCYEVNICNRDNIIKRKNKLAVNKKNIRITMIYCHQGVFVKRDLFEKYGYFDVKYKIAADYEWLLRMYDNGVDIKYSDFVVANFRQGGTSTIYENETYEELQQVAISALYKLKKENIITKDYFKEMYDNILKYYNHVELIRIARSEILKQQMIFHDDLKIKIKKVLPEGKYSIFGCGVLGEECLMLMQQLGFTVDCFWDNDSTKWGITYKNIIIRSPQEMIKKESRIIICSSYYAEDISEQLCKMGFIKDIDFVDYNMIRKSIGLIIKKHILKLF